MFLVIAVVTMSVIVISAEENGEFQVGLLKSLRMQELHITTKVDKQKIIISE